MSQLTQQRDGNGTHGEAQTISLQNKGRSKRNGDGQLENNRIVLKQAHPNDQNHSDEEVKQGTCLYISNLSHKVTDQQLMNIFSAYGKVDYANICYEPYSQQQKGQRIPRGIGFVKYVDGRDAQRAIDKLNGKMIKKKEIKIMISRREEPRLTQKGPYFGKSSKRGINKKEIEVDNYTKDYSKRRNGQSPNNRELDSDYASRRSSSSSSESNGDLTYQQKIINQGKNNQRKQDFEKEEAFSDQNGVAAEKDQNSEMTANNTNGFYEQHINRDPNLEGDSQKNQSVRLDQENNTQNNNRSTKGNGNHENSQRSFYQTPERSVRHRRDSTKSRSRSDKKNSSSSQNKSSNNSHSSRSQHSNYRSSNHHRGSRYSSSSSSPSQRSSSSSSSSQASSNKQRKRSSSSTSSSSPSRSSSSSSSSREAENRQKDNHIKRSQNNYQHKKNIVTHKSSSSRQSNRNRRSSTADRMQQQKQSQPQN